MSNVVFSEGLSPLTTYPELGPEVLASPSMLGLAQWPLTACLLVWVLFAE